MNKKVTNSEKKFNKNEYDKEYLKSHYKRINILCKPSEYDNIVSYCIDNGIKSKSAYIIACCQYCIDNNIDVM